MSQEDQTNVFLKTNGPMPGEFAPSPEVNELLRNEKDEFKKFVILQSNVHTKQNDWLIRQIIGLKGAHRIIHERLADGDKRFEKVENALNARNEEQDKSIKDHFEKVDATLQVFTGLRDKYLSKQKLVRHVLWIISSLLLIPAGGMIIGETASALVRKWMHLP